LDELKKVHDELKDAYIELETKFDHQKGLYTTCYEELKELKVKEKELTGKMNDQEELIASLKSDKEDLKGSVASLQSSLKEESKLKTEYKDELDKTSVALEEARKALQDQVLDQKIASRKSVQLIKDLKSQLAKVTMEYENARKTPAIPEEALAKEAPSPSPSPPLATKLEGRRSTISEGEGSSPPPSSSTPEDDELKRLLAKRLEMLLNENAAVREKVKFLESSIQALHVELEQKKTLLNQYIGNKGNAGEISTSNLSKEEISNLINNLVADNKALANEVDNLGRKLKEATKKV
jgi:chromosome segregation ATPase